MPNGCGHLRYGRGDGLAHRLDGEAIAGRSKVQYRSHWAELSRGEPRWPSIELDDVGGVSKKRWLMAPGKPDDLPHSNAFEADVVCTGRTCGVIVDSSVTGHHSASLEELRFMAQASLSRRPR